jgi:hypothetical protein
VGVEGATTLKWAFKNITWGCALDSCASGLGPLLVLCKNFKFGVLYKRRRLFSSGQWPLATEVLGQLVWRFTSIVYLASTWAHAPSDPVTVLYFWARSHRRKKRRLALSSQHVSAWLPLDGDLWNVCWGVSVTNTGQFKWRPKYILSSPATSNRHKSALFEWNSMSVRTAEGVQILRERATVLRYMCNICPLPPGDNPTAVDKYYYYYYYLPFCLEWSLNCTQISQSSPLKTTTSGWVESFDKFPPICCQY